MHLMRLTAIAGFIFAGGIGTAIAACEPPCKKGEICRYEAAGGKFYCAMPVSKPKPEPKPAPNPPADEPADATPAPAPRKG